MAPGRCSCECSLQFSEGDANFDWVAKEKFCACGAGRAHKNADPAAHRNEGGFVGEVVAEVNGQGTAQFLRCENMENRFALASDGAWQNLKVAEILKAAQVLSEWAQPRTNLPPDFTLVACGGSQ
jgi:hypothetical protein